MDKETKKDLQALLSGLLTDANMAIKDIWDRSDDGFQCQIELIERFGNKHGITINDNS